jgi:hypothetical protein
MSIDPAGDMFLSVGYNEGYPSIWRATTANPQSQSTATAIDESAPWWHVATDGINYYIADGGGGNYDEITTVVNGQNVYNYGNHNFVVAYKVSDGKTYPFTDGVDVRLPIAMIPVVSMLPGR